MMMCCMAMIPSCLACQENVTIEEFCLRNYCETTCPLSVPIPDRYCNSDMMHMSQCEYDEYCCEDRCMNTTFAQCHDFTWNIAMTGMIPCNHKVNQSKTETKNQPYFESLPVSLLVLVISFKFMSFLLICYAKPRKNLFYARLVC